MAREIKTSDDFIDAFVLRGQAREQAQEAAGLLEAQVLQLKGQISDDNTKDRAIPTLLYGLASKNESEEGMRFADALAVHIGLGKDISTFLEENPHLANINMVEVFGTTEDINNSLTPIKVQELPALPAGDLTNGASDEAPRRRGRPRKEVSSAAEVLPVTTADTLKDKYPAIGKLFEEEVYWVEEGGKRYTVQRNLSVLIASSKGKELSESSLNVYSGQVFSEIGLKATKLEGYGRSNFISESNAEEALLKMEKVFSSGKKFKTLQLTEKNVKFEKPPKKK